MFASNKKKILALKIIAPKHNKHKLLYLYCGKFFIHMLQVFY